MDLIFKDKPKTFDSWWVKWTYEMGRNARRYPGLSAKRKSSVGGVPGEWEIFGPEVGVIAFRQLASEAARHIGFRGGDLGAVQFWLDHMQGDHILKRSPKRRRTEYTEDSVQIVVRADGTKEGWRGRQKVG